MQAVVILLLAIAGLAAAGNRHPLEDDYSQVVSVRKKRCGGFECAGGELESSERQLFLNAHNSMRAQLAAGEGAAKCGLLPQASNMYKLKWDCDLEGAAQAWAEQCAPQAGFKVENRSQNFAFVPYVRVGDPNTPHIVKTLKSWWEQILKVDTDLVYRADTGIQAWANMAKDSATAMGCAVKNCNGQLSITCFYDHAGDIPNQPIYESGYGCTHDFECTRHENSHCVPRESLCFVDDSASGESLTSSICPQNPIMSDLARTTVVDWHNALRAKVILGTEPDGKGGWAPAGTNMLEMLYDCGLERSAQGVVDKCLFQDTRGGLGENLYQTSISSVEHDPVALVERAMSTWWATLHNIGIGPNNTFSASAAASSVKYYTQMAWSATFRVGCAVKTCEDSMNLVACHYSPSGNKINRRIYQLGEPCHADYHCDRGQSCEHDTGLCQVVFDPEHPFSSA